MAACMASEPGSLGYEGSRTAVLSAAAAALGRSRRRSPSSSPPIPPYPKRRPLSTLRLALCGCGKVAEHHVTAMRRFDAPVTLICTIDVREERHEAIQGLAGVKCPAFQSLNTALASEEVAFDAVAILLPHHLHETAAIEALEAGKHVLLEKPMATDLAACDRILSAAAARPQQVLAVAENASFWPEIRIARSLIREGAIGEVVTARAHYYEAMASTPFGGSDKAKRQKTDRDNLGWRASKEQCGGGIIFDGGQHWIRGLREFLGEISSVVAVTATPSSFIEGESLAHAIFKHESGKTSSYQATLLSSEATMAHATESWFRCAQIILGTCAASRTPRAPTLCHACTPPHDCD
jgi:predicted dehydrogenase